MSLPNMSGFTCIDHAADPSSAGELQRNAERLMLFDGGQVQELVKKELAGVHPGLNRLRNPSFELDADGVNPPTGWVYASGDGGEVDDGDKYDGVKSVLIPGAAVDESHLRQTLAVKKGQYVRASVACKTSAANHARLQLYVDGAHRVLAFHSGGGTWEILSGIYGPIAADGNLNFYLFKATAAATDIWFDQAVLEVFDAPVYPVDYLTFRDMAADPVNAGELQLNGSSLKFHDGVAVRRLLHEGDSEADIAFTGAPGGHCHSGGAEGNTINHANLINVSANQHHAQVHMLSGADHSAPNSPMQYMRTVLEATIAFDDASPKALFTVQDGDIITGIWAEVTTFWDGAGTVNIGDGVVADGYAADGHFFKAGVGYNLYNADGRGAYLWDAANSHKRDKIYAGADTIDAIITQVGDTQGEMTIWVEILRLK